MAINNGFDTRYHDINNTDTRRRKGSFFTPRVWVERSQEYIKACLGDDWQDNYYIWDCAAGTGNLLTGLTNKYNIYASTLDKQDVDVIQERINNDIQALPSHVFQFDFLNDDFSRLPQSLQDIISDPIKRKKLVIYINPPYVVAKTSNTTKTKLKYKKELGKASSDLCAQFLMRIHNEIKGCIIAEFSKLTALQAPTFSIYRQHFKADLMRMFIVPGDTFDNVKGQFPIGFKIWNTDSNNVFKSTITDVYDKNNENIGTKELISYDGMKRINEWYKQFYDNKNDAEIGILHHGRNDFQHMNITFISNNNTHDNTSIITPNNLRYACMYYAVQKCIKATWINDRDQFLYPKETIGTKKIISYDGMKLINAMLEDIKGLDYKIELAHMLSVGSDFQHQNVCFIDGIIANRMNGGRHTILTDTNFIVVSIFYAVYHSIKATWINDRDQFLYPHDSYKSDIMFHNDCLAYTLFTNNIQYKYCKDGNNYFIPFTEEDVNTKERYKTSFMTDYMNGKYTYKIDDLFTNGTYKNDKLVFSKEAQDVFDSAKKLYTYYHKQKNSNPNAALYDIKEYFQGRNSKGRMNSKSDDVYYTECLNAMNRALDVLRGSIAEKTYKYGFLI